MVPELLKMTLPSKVVVPPPSDLEKVPKLLKMVGPPL